MENSSQRLGETLFLPDGGTLYPRSVHRTAGGATVYMARAGGRDWLLAPPEAGFSGTVCGGMTQAPLSHENASLLRQLFPFTAPAPVLRRKCTVGVGDRLGIAAPGHLRVFSRLDAVPVLAQQSIRELTLTGRTFSDVLDSATFAVFREDFQKGFGADGDHLKNPHDVEYALACGYTMITLDCSEYIDSAIAGLSDAQVQARYAPCPALEQAYIGKTFPVGDAALTCTAAELRRAALTYLPAIQFIEEIYTRFLRRRDVDFEISIDETDTPTTPFQHFFVARELQKRQIRFATIAPRFIGEFQKGVDYMGDPAQFSRDLKLHAAIAETLGYKLSIHSGSDKFAVFPAIGRWTNGHFHLKTAGTNWLTAMELAARRDPALYREVHEFALSAFAAARQYYHVSTDLGKIPPLASLSDDRLPDLFRQNDARQLIHITYGLILTAKNADGSSRFRDRLYALWARYAEEYAQMLDAHIGRHLETLLSGAAT